MRFIFCVYHNVVWPSTVHRDGDGVPDGFDNCVDLPNGEQADADDDKIGMKILTYKTVFVMRERNECNWFFSDSSSVLPSIPYMKLLLMMMMMMMMMMMIIRLLLFFRKQTV